MPIIHKWQKSYTAMTDLVRHVDFLNCGKLLRVLASLSRRSAPVLLAAMLPVSRSLCCKRKSITSINLAGEWNGVKIVLLESKWIRSRFLFFCCTTLQLMSTGRRIFEPFQQDECAHLLAADRVTNHVLARTFLLNLFRLWVSSSLLEFSTADNVNGWRQTFRMTWLQMERIISSKAQKDSLVWCRTLLWEWRVSNNLPR